MVTPTIDGLLVASQNGQWQSFQVGALSTVTSPTVAGTTASRRPIATFTIPTVGGTVSNGLTTMGLGMDVNAPAGTIIAQEINFGTYTFGTGWTGTGTAMPTKTIQGTSVQTASPMLVLAIITNATATTPTITITYTNQIGTAGQVMTYVLPTSPGSTSAYILNSFMASGDIGVRAISAVTSSAGSSGTFQLFGCLPINLDTADGYLGQNSPLVAPNPQFQFVGGEKIGYYQVGQATNNNPTAYGLKVIGA